MTAEDTPSGFKFKPKFKPRNVENVELSVQQKEKRLNRKEEFENRMKKLEDKKHHKKQVYSQSQMAIDDVKLDFQEDSKMEEKIDLLKFRFDKQLEMTDMPLKEYFHKIHNTNRYDPNSEDLFDQIHVLSMPPLPKLKGNGHIGEIKVRKSGKCELVINDMVFDLSLGIQSQILQSVVQTQVFGEPKLVDFGDVQSKIVASLKID
eukprot:NODE_588_length_5657_cov_0.948183.p4 type:complete len:205 gc:universal NODE_588_length_5657_cov_0.948183:4619-4005(-)